VSVKSVVVLSEGCYISDAHARVQLLTIVHARIAYEQPVFELAVPMCQCLAVLAVLGAQLNTSKLQVDQGVQGVGVYL
jgi:hypothetical protein